jgi:hypothetical protein
LSRPGSSPSRRTGEPSETVPSTRRNGEPYFIKGTLDLFLVFWGNCIVTITGKLAEGRMDAREGGLASNLTEWTQNVLDIDTRGRRRAR